MRLPRTAGLGLAALLVLAGLVAGCSRGDGSGDDAPDDVTMEIEITPDPPEVGPAVVEVTLTDADGVPINGADLEIEGNMSHAGMEPVIVGATGGQNGRYTSEDFEFTMGGDWIITVSGTLPGGQEIERVFDLTGVAS